MRKSTLLRSCIYIASFLSSVSAFSVTFGTPTQCDDFTVSWTGGQAPFQILLTPAYHPQVNISVPSSAFSNGEGSYPISQLPLPKDMRFLLTMSDSTGFGTGGTTTLLTVGAPIANNNCDTTGSQDFYFQLPLALKQCAEYNVTGYGLAVPPVTITGLVPGGEFVILPPSNNTNYTTWIADVLEGTSMLFFMTDSLGRQGGVSDVLMVAASTDASCLVAGAVSSTVSAPSQPTSNQSILPVSNTPSAGVIAGATVGSVVFLALLITLGVCWRRKALRSSRVTDKVDSYGVKGDYQVQQNFQSKNQTDHQPLGPSHLANVFTSDPFSQHLRQMSYADSSVGSSSVAGTGQISPNTFVSQTSPVHPGTQSHAANVSAGGVVVNDPYAPFSQTQPSRQTSDPVAEYGDVGNSSPMSAANRRMAAMAVQSASPNYAFPYQTTPVSHVAPPGTLPHHTSPGSTTVSGPPSPINQAQPLSLSSNMERFARPVDAGGPPPGRGIAALADQTATDGSTEYILHTDVEDVQVARDAKKVVELPPQYAHRELPDSQPTLAPSSES